ncbi:acyl-CoA thioesterase [Neotabrizicola sp. VNH66]|uniref:acyl-CoA thioesterase n=1 Tax=Neotabrizicola sp. VNH66 TaxID=3400918 RepID=UPI003BFDB2F8
MAFRISMPVGIGDCDLTGIAFHPAYVAMLVRVLEAFFGSLGAAWPEAMRDRQLGFPTVRLSLEFRRPARYGEMLDFEVSVHAVGRSSVDLVTTVQVGGQLAWRAEHRLVQTSLTDHRARPWDDVLRAGLMRQMGGAG